MNMKLLRAPLWLWLAFAPTAAFAVQGTGCMPTTGTVSGLTMAQDINAGIAALISSNSGSSSPTTDCSVAPIKGQFWLDTSVTPNLLKQYDGSSTWVVIGALDSTNHLWAPPIGGGTATLASGTTTDLWSSSASSITVSGTTTIAALANASAVSGTVKIVTASGIFTLTHNATSLILPGATNITTAVGDQFFVKALTATNVAVIGFTRADGSAVTNPSVPLGTVLYGDYGTIPAKAVSGTGQALSRASYPAYLAAVTRAQSGTLTAGNNTIASVGNTAGLGAGMPLEGTGIPAGATIASVTSSTIVMSTTATANGAQTVTAFITGYGSGGDSTTVGVKNCQGRVIAGRDPSATNLASATAINSSQGSKTQTIAQINLPAVNLPGNVSDPGHAHGPASGSTGFLGGVGAPFINVISGGSFQMSFLAATGTNTTGISVSTPLGGTNTPLTTVQPTIIAECVVVVLP